MNAFAAAPATPIPGAKKGGVLTVLNSGIYSGGTFDPSNSYDTQRAAILSGLVVRSLTQYVYDPKSQQMVLVPDLATDLGRPSLDFKTWRYTLRPGVKFENGQPVTAQDLKYGIERSFDTTTFPSVPPYSIQYFVHGDAYQGPYESPGPYDGVTVSGNTITIHMSKPFPDMPYWGAWAAMSPIPPGQASDPATYLNHPWATGPYKFKTSVPNKSLVLVKNPYWDPNTDPGRHQYVDEFDFNFNTDPSKIDQTMLADTGAGQTTLSTQNVLPEDYQKFNRTASDRLILGGNSCTFFWYPDNRKITDINVRRALAYAYPYRRLWAANGAIPGVTRLAGTNVMPPGVAGRGEFNPLPGHVPGTTDPAEAKALLTAAGKLNYPIEFPYIAPDQVTTKNIIVRALKRAGFDPQPLRATADNYYSDFNFNPKAPLNLRQNGWCADWPGGSQWLPVTFETTDVAGGDIYGNLEVFSSKAVDDRIQAVPNLLLTEQPAAWNALDKLIQTRYFPVVVTGYGGIAMMRGSKVHDAVDDPTLGYPTWKDIWLG